MWTATAFSLFVSSVAVRAAPPGAVCFVVAAPGVGLEADAVRAALVVEGRKRGGVAPPVVTALSGDRCPDGAVAVTLGPGPMATLCSSEAPALVLDLAASPPVDRAPEIARVALDRVARGQGSPETLLESLIDLDSPVPVPAPPLEWTLRALLSVGGGYIYEFGAGVHRGDLEAEAALLLFGGRLSVGLVGTWSPERAVGDELVAVDVSAGEFLGIVRGGFFWGPVLLRLGVGAGWQWRRLSARARSRFSEVFASSGAAALALELDALWPLSERLFVSVALPGRVYFGGVDHSWQGRPLYGAARGSVGVAVRGGVTF